MADLSGAEFLPKPTFEEERFMAEVGLGRQWSFDADLSFYPPYAPKEFVVQLLEGQPRPVEVPAADGPLVGAVHKRGDQIRIDLQTGKVTRLTPTQVLEAEARAEAGAGRPARLQLMPATPIPAPRVVGPFLDPALAAQLRAVPETAAVAGGNLKLFAQAHEMKFPARPAEGARKPQPVTNLFVQFRAVAEVPGVKWRRVSLIREDQVWHIKESTSLIEGEWSINAWSHPDWKPGLKIDVVVEGIDAQGKPFQVRQSNVEINAARRPEKQP